MEFTPQELWASTGTPVRIVLFVLLAMAIWCVYVGIERVLTLARARRHSRELAQAIAKPMSSGSVDEALQIAKKDTYKEGYLTRLLVAGLTEFSVRQDRLGIEAAERALERTAIAESESLRKGMNILATTGSTAPFVGLVGTIFGIINAFAGMAESGSGGLASVSAGIAEALITTAFGLLVAIPAVWCYNYFTTKIENLTVEMTYSSKELIDYLIKSVGSEFGRSIFTKEFQAQKAVTGHGHVSG